MHEREKNELNKEEKNVKDLFRRGTYLLKNLFYELTIASGPNTKKAHEIYLTHRKNDIKANEKR